MNLATLTQSLDTKPEKVGSSFTAPSFVWVDDSSTDANTFAIFRRHIVLGERPILANFRLFADTRYRLRVNGTVVGYGPCRFDPKAPQYDDYDLSPYFEPGQNCITVEVHHRGENSFQAAPSFPGFIAWGLISETSTETTMETPGEWEVHLSDAWVRESPAFSFALPSVEMLDLSALPSAWFRGGGSEHGWAPPKVIESASWGDMMLRTAPMPSGEILAPSRSVFLGSLKSEEQQVMFHRRFEPADLARGRRFLSFAIWLHSSRAQEVELATFWGRHFLNGKELKSQRDTTKGNRELTLAPLAAGWNLLYGEIEVLSPSWGFTVGWPRQADLTFAARPSLADAGTLLISDLQTRESLQAIGHPSDETSLSKLDSILESVTLSAKNAFPARECAWHAAGENVAPPSEVQFPLEVPRSVRGEGAVVLDFEREWIGHPIVKIKCSAPCVLDIANDEALREDGMLRFYESIHLTNNVDRYWVPPGSHCIESFHERGGRYLQINVHSESPVELEAVSVRSSLANLPIEGSFQCSDLSLNWIWDTGVRTLQASMTDGWIDPWREQGCYLGDVYVEWLATRMYTPDLRLIQRCLQLWEQCQREDGQMPAVVPAHYTATHADYTLTWILLLRDYLAWTGDRETVLQLWPTVEKIWQSSLWQAGPTNLWNGEGANIFADWGATQTTCSSDANLLLNAFRVGALRASEEIARSLGFTSQAELFATEASTVAEVLRTRLWNHQQGAFAAGLEEGALHSETPVHGNILALLFRIASPEQEGPVLNHVLRSLRRDLKNVSGVGRRDGHCDFYFLNFALTMLHERGLHAEAMELIHGFWGVQQARGILTFPETWPSMTEGVGSYCHGWACSPMISLTSQILGLHPAGNLVMISPHFPPGVDWASGTYLHGPNKKINLRWERKGDAIEMIVHAPRGLTKILVPPGVNWKLIEF
jgi:alpha-L-rhamnosidase